MIEQLSVKELMLKYTFSFSHECHCDGYATEIYKHRNFEIRYRKYNKACFRITQDRKLLKQWTPIVQLQSTLKILFENVAL